MNNIKYMLKNAKNRRVIFSVIAVMSVLAAFTVFFVLERPGVTMTADDVPEYISYSESGAVIVEVPVDEEPKYTGIYATGSDLVKNCKWSIYENGVIYFEPVDPTKPYSSYGADNTYWKSYKNEITAVKAADGLVELTSNYSNTGAFSSCPQLLAVDLSECSSLTSIPHNLFLNCHALKDVNLNFGDITSIGNSAFSGCSSLEQFPFEQLTNVSTIGNYAFYSCSSLASADLSVMTQLTAISNYMFCNCTSLTDINFGENSPITSIGSYAFHNCSSLTTADLSGMTQLTAIPNSMFYNCTSLTDVNFGENSPITSIGNSDLIDCQKNLITRVEYPPDVIMGVVNMLKWDLQNRDKVGIQSETISRHSVTYFNMDSDNSIMGYPKSLLGFLKPYIKARF